MSIIEVVLAVAVIIIVLLPASILMNNSLLSSNDQRLKIEADNLATANLEKVQQEAESGPLSGGTTSFTYQSRSGGQYTIFTVVTQFTPLSQAGGAFQLTTICQNQGTTQLQIWSVTATVTWRGMRGARPVTETTEVAPGESGAADLSNGEIAIPVNGVNGTPITTAINYYVTPSGTGAAGWLTSNGYTAAGIPGNTGTTGCGVVTGLPVAGTTAYPDIPQWSWTVELAPNTTPAPGYVATTEASDSNPAGPPLSGPITLHAGEISYALNSNSGQFQVAVGVQTAVTLQTLNFATTPALVTQCEPANGTWVNGNPSHPYIPPASCDNTAVPFADLPVTVANSGIGPTGQYTFGNTNQSIAQLGMLLYPFASGYSVWAGEMPESNPGAAPSGSPLYAPDSGVAPLIGTSTSATVVVPVYPLDLTVSGNTTATEVDGAGYGYALNLAGSASNTGMPLGQYEITPSATPLYVWITPSGICKASAQRTATQLGVCPLTTSPIPVTA
jgi:hypothetical protein